MVIAWPFRGGSSPRGRGKRNDDGRHAPCGGLIPARAGKTSARDDPWLGLTAHPRAGGENRVIAPILVSVRAHPRAGGENHMRPSEAIPTPSLIPARPGKQSRHGEPPFSLEAHPRAGGENRAVIEPAGNSPGSSPRGRGKPHPSHMRPSEARLIPARAGKTTRRLTGPRLSGAHPRAGGENGAFSPIALLLLGSSPRGRGKPCLCGCLGLWSRLIPARAGKTFTGVFE